MNDKELLELAAKAAGRKDCIPYQDRWLADADAWNPLTDDGDALRLAVKLGLDVEMHGCNTTHPYACAYDCARDLHFEEQPDNGDPYAATRRAVVRAAAEIGRSMK